MVVEGDHMSGQRPEDERDGSIKKRRRLSTGNLGSTIKGWFKKDRQTYQTSSEAGNLVRYRLLDEVQKAKTFEDAIAALQALRLTQEYVFPLEPSISSDDPPPIRVVDMIIALQSLRSGRPVSREDIPVPIRSLCDRLLSVQPAQERKVSDEHIVCIDQDGRQIKIPKRVADEFGLKPGEKIKYDTSYENTSLVNSERKATDHQEVVRAIPVGSNFWINLAPVANDNGVKIVFCITFDEYVDICQRIIPYQ